MVLTQSTNFTEKVLIFLVSKKSAFYAAIKMLQKVLQCTLDYIYQCKCKGHSCIKRYLNTHSIYSVDEYQSLTNESHNPWMAVDFHTEICHDIAYVYS
jgi:hypothetical protein